MLRRLVLVGIFVVVEQGTIQQLVYATLLATIYVIVQVAAAPFREPSDNFMAVGCSLCHALLYVVCVIYKYSRLLEMRTLSHRLSCHCVALTAGTARSPT